MLLPPNTKPCPACKGEGRVRPQVPGGVQCSTCRGSRVVPVALSKPEPADPNRHIKNRT